MFAREREEGVVDPGRFPVVAAMALGAIMRVVAGYMPLGRLELFAMAREAILGESGEGSRSMAFGATEPTMPAGEREKRVVDPDGIPFINVMALRAVARIVV